MLIHDSGNKCWKRTTNKIRISLTVEQTLAFVSSPSMVTEVKNSVSKKNFFKFQTHCVTIFYVNEYSDFDPFYSQTLNSSTKNYTQIDLYRWYNLTPFINKPDTLFLPGILVLFWWVFGKIVMMFSNNVSYMLKILTFNILYILMTRPFTMS